MNIAWENKENNLKNVENAVVQAAKNSADILFLPEMCLTGFSMNIGNTAENDFYTVNKMKNLCKIYNIALGFGWARTCGEKAENCYTVLDNNGNELSTYVKIHPFSYSNEDEFFQKGKFLTRYKINNTVFSTVICYDTRFPELFQGICKNQDVTAVVIPANWPAKRASHWRVLTKARAIENQVYILAVNCVGNIGGVEYSGDTCVINPNGEIIACCDSTQQIIYADLDYDIDKLRNSFPVSADRQIELYKSIL